MSQTMSQTLSSSTPKTMVQNSSSHSPKAFKAGQALVNTEYWQQLADEIIDLGGSVQPIALEAIKMGALNLHHKSCHNKNPKNVVFRGKTYTDQSELIRAKLENGKTIEKYPDEVEKELELLLAIQAIAILSPEQENDPERVYSPVLWHRKLHENGSLKKGRLVFHSKFNSCYTKPQFKLNQAKQELKHLAEVEELWKGDLEKAYYGWDEQLFSG